MNYSFFFLSLSGVAATLIVIGLFRTEWRTGENGPTVTTTTETHSQPTNILKRNFVVGEKADDEVIRSITASENSKTEESTVRESKSSSTSLSTVGSKESILSVSVTENPSSHSTTQITDQSTNEKTSNPPLTESTDKSTTTALTTDKTSSTSPSTLTTNKPTENPSSTSPSTLTTDKPTENPSSTLASTPTTSKSTENSVSTETSITISSSTSTSGTIATTTQASSCTQTKLTAETDRIKWQKGADTCESWLIDLTGICTGVDIIIEKINLNGNLNEYLIIAPSEDKLQDEENPIITWTLTSEKKFRIIDSGTAYLKLITSESSTSGSFSITYNCYGKDSLTTTESTTLAPTTGGPEGDAMITVYMKGKSQIQFAENVEAFKTVISNMSTKYCEAENISLEVQPLSSNTFITFIGPCTITWPDFDICVKVTFGIGLNTTENEYEMSKNSLEVMWARYAQTDSGLRDTGLSVYQVPDDNDTYLVGWMAVSFGVLILFIFLIGLMWYYQPFRVYKKMKYDEGTDDTPRVTEIYPNDSAIMYEPGSIVDYLPPKSPGADSSTDDFRDGRSSIAQLDTIPRYGPPAGFGGAIHFFGKRPSERGFENLELVAKERNVTNNTLPRTGTDTAPTKMKTTGTFSDEEEIDTSQLKNKSRTSFYDPTQIHYQDEPMENRRISYTDNEKQPQKSGEITRNSLLQKFPGNISPQKEENVFGATSYNHYQHQPKGYENSAFVDENGGEAKSTLPRNSMQRNRSNSLMQEKQWTFGKPTLILEEEEEDDDGHSRTGSFTTNPLPTLNALAPVADDVENQSMELNDKQSETGQEKQTRLSNGNQHIYDVPKFPVRRFSVDEDA